MDTIKSVGDLPAPKGPSAPAALSSPPQETADSFGRLMRAPKKSGDGNVANKDQADQDEAASDEDGQAPGGTQKKKDSGGLSDLFGQASRTLTGGPADPSALTTPSMLPPFGPAAGDRVAQAAAAEALTQSRCGELVERILVSQPTADGRQEVRLRLDQQWLPNTEVRLLRAESGLSVEFISDDVNSQRFLLPNLSGLRERLAERLSDPVTVRMSENADAGGNNTDTGDGRSRNRRSVFEETGNEG